MSVQPTPASSSPERRVSDLAPADRRKTTPRRRTRRRVAGRRIVDLEDPSQPQYATVSAVAAYFAVDVRTVEKWHEAGHLTIRAFPYARRIALEDVRRFRDAHHQTPQPPGTA